MDVAVTVTYSWGKADSPPCKGGVAAPIKKSSRSEKARPGWSLTRPVAKCVLKHGV